MGRHRRHLCHGRPSTSRPRSSRPRPPNGADDVALGANLSVTFNEPVDASGGWFDISCTTSSTHTATATGGPTTFSINPDTDFVNDETCTFTVFSQNVKDLDATIRRTSWSPTTWSRSRPSAASRPGPRHQRDRLRPAGHRHGGIPGDQEHRGERGQPERSQRHIHQRHAGGAAAIERPRCPMSVSPPAIISSSARTRPTRPDATSTSRLTPTLSRTARPTHSPW